MAIGYNASIKGSSTCANESKPYDDTAHQGSFFSPEFCEDLLSNNLGDNQVLVDNKYSSDIFDFEMKDLVTILPDAVKKYPGLFTFIYA